MIETTDIPILRKGDDVTLDIETVTFGGQGVARYHDFVVFVEGAITGDRVQARIMKKKKNFAEARSLQIIEPSRFRVDHACTHYGICGGCKWQDVDYDAQLEFKRRNVIDVFERIGGFKGLDIPAPLGSPRIFHYRNKMEFTFGDTEWVVDKTSEGPPRSFMLGMHVPQRFDKILHIDQCYLQSPLANDILAFVRDFAQRSGLPPYSVQTNEGFWRFLIIRETVHTGHLMVNVMTYSDQPEIMKEFKQAIINKFPQITSLINGITDRKSQVAFAERENLLHGQSVITEKLDGLEFEISSSSFFQTNTLGAEVLYRTIREMADLKGHEVVLDLYCGTGSIAIYIADRAREVIGIELIESATRNAEKNATRNRADNCRFINGDMRTTLDTLQTKADVVILDPPRSGLHEDVIRSVMRLAPDKIVYVSCNPSTQARDLALMQAHYTIERVQPVDMFPHTYHIENIVQMRKNV